MSLDLGSLDISKIFAILNPLFTLLSHYTSVFSKLLVFLGYYLDINMPDDTTTTTTQAATDATAED